MDINIIAYNKVGKIDQTNSIVEFLKIRSIQI